MHADATRAARWTYGVLSGLTLGATLVLAYTQLHGPECLFRTLVHLPCPGCGMTRSLECIWHGRPLTSFRYHPLGLPLFVTCLVGLALAVNPAWSRPGGAMDRAVRLVHRAPAQAAILVLLLGVWALRLAFIVAGSRWFLW